MIPRGMMLFLEQIGVSLTPDSNDPGLMFYVIIFEKIQNYMTQVHYHHGEMNGLTNE